MSEAGVAPAAGRIPTKKPKKEPMFIAIIVFLSAPNALPTSFMLTDNFDIWTLPLVSSRVQSISPIPYIPMARTRKLIP